MFVENMFIQVPHLTTGVITFIALIRLLSGVGAHMRGKVRLRSRTVVTLSALKRPLSGVGAHMRGKVRLLKSGVITIRALVGLLSVVHGGNVFFQKIRPGGGVITYGTREFLFLGVFVIYMSLHVTLANIAEIAMRAFV